MERVSTWREGGRETEQEREGERDVHLEGVSTWREGGRETEQEKERREGWREAVYYIYINNFHDHLLAAAASSDAGVTAAPALAAKRRLPAAVSLRAVDAARCGGGEEARRPGERSLVPR